MTQDEQLARPGRWQIRKRSRLWEVWRFDGRSWIMEIQSQFWTMCMFLATGDEFYARQHPDYARVMKLVWRP